MSRQKLTPDQQVRGQALAKTLAAARIRGGFTQAQLAVCAGIPLDSVRKLEQGVVPTPGFFLVAALAGALGLSLDDLAAERARDD